MDASEAHLKFVAEAEWTSLMQGKGVHVMRMMMRCQQQPGVGRAFWHWKLVFGGLAEHSELELS